MADAADSKSAKVYPCVGSSPTSGTNIMPLVNDHRVDSVA